MWEVDVVFYREGVSDGASEKGANVIENVCGTKFEI